MRKLWGPRFSVFLLLAIMLALPSARAARDRSALGDKIADKLPPKSASKSTYIDFSSDETAVVLAPRSSELDRILRNSDRDVSLAKSVSSTATVRSRKILAAPDGDSAEPMSAMAIAAPTPAKVSMKATAPVPILTIEKVEPVFVGPPAPTVPVPPPAQTVDLPTEKFRVDDMIVREKESPAVNQSLTTTESRLPRRDLSDGFFKSIDAKSMVFIRAGVFNANYKKFDDRMKNSATSMGLAAARDLETAWGEFEVRAAFDVYHPMDQSVTIDNIRMVAARTEVAYWLSHSRVKPGLSLGLGMADYSIRSYRSISDANENIVTLKTHAKSRAFSVIPASSLRVELAKELVIDTQAEFLALLGGDSSDAAQGLGVNVSLGWMF